MEGILKLIYGMLITIIIIISYILSSIFSRAILIRDKTGGAVDKSIDFISNDLNGNGNARNNTIDFPILDPVVKTEYTKAFHDVYTAKKKPPISTYNEIDGSLKYSAEGQSIYTGAYHIGQRKLILNEIQFLTRVMSGASTPSALIVYAGAAPSNKGALLASLFPAMKFLLIDPNKFDIRSYGDVIVKHLGVMDDTQTSENIIDAAITELKTANICTVRTLMSAAIAEELGKRFAELYFISDIRTNMISDGPTTLDILWNSAQHIQWVELMKPRETMLKFRLPFFEESEKELLQYEKLSHQLPYSEAFNSVPRMRAFTSRTFEFYEGDIYLQPWAPISSTESRLVFKGVPALRKYELSEYEDKFFYYNKILRNYQLYQNPNADKKLGFDHCVDCALENKIWTDYCNATGKECNVKKYVKILSDLTFRPLLHHYHGKMFGPVPIQILDRRFRSYK